MKKSVLLLSLALAALAVLNSCGKNMDPTTQIPVTVVLLYPTASPTPSPTATPVPTVTPQPVLSVSWTGLPAAQNFSTGVRSLTMLQVILEAKGGEPVSVSRIVFGGENPPSLNPVQLIPDTLADDPAADGNYFYSPSPVGYPTPVAEASVSLTGLAFTGINDLTLAPDQPQTFLLVFDFVGSPGFSGTYFSTLSAAPIQAYGVSTGLAAAVSGGPIIGNVQTINTPVPSPEPTQVP